MEDGMEHAKDATDEKGTQEAEKSVGIAGAEDPGGRNEMSSSVVAAERSQVDDNQIPSVAVDEDKPQAEDNESENFASFPDQTVGEDKTGDNEDTNFAVFPHKEADFPLKEADVFGQRDFDAAAWKDDENENRPLPAVFAESSVGVESAFASETIRSGDEGDGKTDAGIDQTPPPPPPPPPPVDEGGKVVLDFPPMEEMDGDLEFGKESCADGAVKSAANSDDDWSVPSPRQPRRSVQKEELEQDEDIVSVLSQQTDNEGEENSGFLINSPYVRQKRPAPLTGDPKAESGSERFESSSFQTDEESTDTDAPSDGRDSDFYDSAVSEEEDAQSRSRRQRHVSAPGSALPPDPLMESEDKGEPLSDFGAMDETRDLLHAKVGTSADDKATPVKPESAEKKSSSSRRKKKKHSRRRSEILKSASSESERLQRRASTGSGGRHSRRDSTGSSSGRHISRRDSTGGSGQRTSPARRISRRESTGGSGERTSPSRRISRRDSTGSAGRHSRRDSTGSERRMSSRKRSSRRRLSEGDDLLSSKQQHSESRSSLRRSLSKKKSQRKKLTTDDSQELKAVGSSDNNDDVLTKSPSSKKKSKSHKRSPSSTNKKEPKPHKARKSSSSKKSKSTSGGGAGESSSKKKIIKTPVPNKGTVTTAPPQPMPILDPDSDGGENDETDGTMQSRRSSASSAATEMVSASSLPIIASKAPPDVKVLVLISSLSADRSIATKQGRAFSILDGQHIPYESVDAANPDHEAQRNQLLKLSSPPGSDRPPPRYPQFFLVTDSDTMFEETTFKGDWEWFEEAHELGDLETMLFTATEPLEWSLLPSSTPTTTSRKVPG